MDSGSSGSMPSSSGGDDEFDSRGESISAFLNSNPNPSHTHLGDGNIPGLHRQHQLHQPQLGPFHTSPSMFDPMMSNFFDTMAAQSTSTAAGPHPMLNLDPASAWSNSKSPRPGLNCTDHLGGGFGLAPMQLQQPLLGYANHGQDRGSCPDTASFLVRSDPEAIKQLGSISGSATNEQVPITASNTAAGNNGVPGGSTGPRNPKKRSRASRRAPTTVLTTDTTNFRAMVQEFTGIPAPPFTAPSFQRSRFDLFGTGSGGPSYLLRPFAQKIQPLVPPFAPPPPPSSASSTSSPSSFPTTMIDALASTTAGIGSDTANTDLGLLKSPPRFLNHQTTPNQVLDFQSLFQAPSQKYPTAGSALFPAKTLGSSDIQGDNDHRNPHMKLGMLEGFGLSHGQVSTQLQAGLPNTETSDRTLSDNNRNNNNDGNPHPNWHGDGSGTNDGSNQGMLRPPGGNFGRISNVERGPGSTAGPRGEGMVESWICSSD